MKSRYVCIRSANVGDIKRNKALIRVFGYVISDSGKYSGFGYPDIQVPVEITNLSILNTCIKILNNVYIFKHIKHLYKDS